MGSEFIINISTINDVKLFVFLGFGIGKPAFFVKVQVRERFGAPDGAQAPRNACWTV